MHGQILDLDGHVMFDHEVVAELLGEELAGPLVRWMEPLTSAVTPELRGEARARAIEDIGSVKGFLALGAVDVDDRLSALDRLGIARQLILPPVSWPALDAAGPRGALARGRYNAWISEWAAATDRLVPVAVLAMLDPETALHEAEAIAAAGFTAVEVPFAFPPGGRSPGDAAWDPLWSLLAGHEMSVVLHLGGAGPGAAVAQPRSFLDSGWFDIAHLQPPEFPASMAGLRENAAAGPVSLATLHVPAEVFCTSLILGGALERHPDLMVLVLEMGAQWVASWVERLDGVGRSYKAYGLEPLTSLPSEVIARQVRVTPFEANDVASWIERDGLRDVYTFASDYPHAEGGRDPIGRLSANLSRLGPEATKRFFVDNAAPILGRSTLVGRA